MFNFDFNYNNISRSLALSQLAIVSYMIGVILYNKHSSIAKYNCDYMINLRLINFVKILFLFATIYIVFVIYSQSSDGEKLDMIDSTSVSIYIMMFSIYVLLKNEYYKDGLKENSKMFLKINGILIISIFIVVGFALWFGDRGPVIQVGLIMLFVYSIYVKRIAFRYLLGVVMIGFIVMTFISATRGSNNNLRDSSVTSTLNEGVSVMSKFTNLWDYGMDFIINARSAYISFEIVEEQGLLYGKSYFPYLFSPIPGLPILMTDFFLNSDPETVSTAKIISLREDIDDWGLGTNAVGDIYMNFSSLGVVLLFFLFGIFVRWLELGNNIYKKIIFITVISLAVYLPRASLIIVFEGTRTALFLWLLFKVFNIKLFSNEDFIY